MTETRVVQIRSVGEEGRIVRGIAVPFGQTINVGGYKEAFDRGAISSVEGTKLFWDHKEIIGKVVRGEDTEDGYEIEAHISDTPRGNEARTLLKDGVIDKFSVGFVPKEHRMENGVTIRTNVELREVSLVAFPAYSGASVSEVRAEETNNTNHKENETMSNDNEIRSEDFADLKETVSDLERRMSTFGASTATSNTANYSNAGDFLKSLARGEDQAQTLVRAFTGADTTDVALTSRPVFVDKAIKIRDEQRPLTNFFGVKALPGTGNVIQYAVPAATTGAVGVQATEGADLPYMEIAVATATTNVLTYGGYSSLSRQLIERSDIAYLDSIFKYQVAQYAKATEQAVRNALTGATGVNTVQAGGATPTGIQWLTAVANAAAAIEDNSFGDTLEALVVDRATFTKLSTLLDSTGRPLFAISGQAVNALGTANATAFQANVAGIPVITNPALAAGSVFGVSRNAINVWENSGAPIRLQDENVINLTKDFSLYGYLAVGVVSNKSIVKINLAA